MKNRLIPSILISVILTIFLFNITIGWTFPITEKYLDYQIAIVGIVLSLFALLTIIYFLRNYAKQSFNFIEKIYNFFFINVGNFKINQKIFFITTLAVSGVVMILTTSFNLYWILFAKFSEHVNNLTIDMLLFLVVVQFLAYIAAAIWLIIIYKKSRNFYYDSRFAFILIPFFGWIYFFTNQPAKNYFLY